MTKINSQMLADMHARRLSGESVAEIAARHSVKPSSVYQQFNRKLGGTPLPGPANDNHADRVTRMSAYNGGCSTVSGKLPVTLRRVPTIDGPANDNAPERVAA